MVADGLYWLTAMFIDDEIIMYRALTGFVLLMALDSGVVNIMAKRFTGYEALARHSVSPAEVADSADTDTHLLILKIGISL